MNDIEIKMMAFTKAAYQQTVKVAPKIAVGLITILAFWLVAILVKHCIVRLSKRSRNRIHLYRILGSIAMGVIVFMGLITGLGTMGLNVGALIASLGLAGFAVGFALKDTLSNMIAGFMVLFYQPFRVGDYITVSGVEGRVVNITLRYTVVRSEEKHTYVPNSTVLSNPVTVKEGEDELA